MFVILLIHFIQINLQKSFYPNVPSAYTFDKGLQSDIYMQNIARDKIFSSIFLFHVLSFFPTMFSFCYNISRYFWKIYCLMRYFIIMFFFPSCSYCAVITFVIIWVLPGNFERGVPLKFTLRECSHKLT